jgi:SAM-dependent methyltransferase
MVERLRELAKRTVNGQLARLGLEVRRQGIEKYIRFERTIKAAKAAGLTLGDYIDNVMNNTPGATQATIDAMRDAGVFASNPRTVLEIGPGSGRYLEKTLAECTPSRYEIYETAELWAEYLVDHYPVLLQPTNGTHLKATADNSIDLLQAHKVFNGVTFLTTIRYFAEIGRVVRPGGWAVFDALTETALDIETVHAWRTRGGSGHDSYPAPLPRSVVVDIFSTNDFSLKNTHIGAMGVGRTEVLMFRKE